MKLSKEDIIIISRLSNLEIPTENQVLKMEEALSLAEKMTEPSKKSEKNSSGLTMRADTATEGLAAEEILDNAPDKKDGFFAVPRGNF